MTLQRTRHRPSTVEFQCDGCGTCLDTEKFSLSEAVDVMKAQGWKARRAGADAPWTHYCDECSL